MEALSVDASIPERPVPRQQERAYRSTIVSRPGLVPVESSALAARGLIVGGIDFTNIFVTLKGQSEATLADAQKAGAVTLNIGVFLNAVIQFLIVSFAVFLMIKVLTRLHVREEAAPAPPPPPPRSEVLLEEIRDLLAARRDQPG
jgi:large conductance mechanosensitive channel protein